jgi:RND superfamily putative drug exporter
MSVAARFARAVVALRHAIVALWVLAAIAATLLLPSFEEAQTGGLGDLAPNDADAIQAEIRSSELFGFPLLSRTLIVQRDPDGLSAAAQARIGTRAVAVNRHVLPGLEEIGGALPVTNVVGAPPFARERSTTGITYLLFGPDVGRRARERLAEELVEQRVDRPGDALAGITGAIPARAEQRERIQDALPLVEALTIVIVTLAVGLHFRALVAPLVNLAAIAIAYLVSMRALATAGRATGVSVPSEVEPVIVVLLFGVLTDYAIFFLSRFRRRLGTGSPPVAAAESATRDLAGIVVFAGLTIVGCSAALVVAELGFFQAFGPGLAIAVLVGMLVAITFVPAMLALVGRAVFWPSRPGVELASAATAEETPDEQVGRPVRSRALRVASRRPGLTALVCLLGLGAAASGLARLEVGQTLMRGLPADSEPRRAYAAASQGFAPGILSPTVLIVEQPLVARDERLALRRLQRMLERTPGVAEVVGPRQQPVERNLGAVFSPTGNAVRYLIVLDADPLGATAIRRLRSLRRDLPGMLERAGLPYASFSIAGDTALSEETVTKTTSDLGRIAPATLAVAFLMLVVFLRSLVAPLYLVAASVLALAASLGLGVYVLQDLLGYEELTFYVPFTASVLLVALGSDYNVFLAGRIWQEARSRPLREAVAVAGARAATPITVAGIVLALSFALLALVPLRPFRELAFVISLGLVIDAFLVRTLLVPALITLVGPLSGWPRRLRHVGVPASSRA